MENKYDHILGQLVPRGNIQPLLALRWWNDVPELVPFKAVYDLPFALPVNLAGVKISQITAEVDKVISFLGLWADILKIEEVDFRHFTTKEKTRIAWFGRIYDNLRTTRIQVGPNEFLPTGIGIAGIFHGAEAFIDSINITTEARQQAADFLHAWMRGIEDYKKALLETFEQMKKSPRKKPGTGAEL